MRLKPVKKEDRQVNDVKLWKEVDQIVQRSCCKCKLTNCDWRLNPRKLIKSGAGVIRKKELTSGFLECISEERL